jgi:hypothetical protein
VRDLAIRCDAPGCRRGVIWSETFQHYPCPLCEGRGSISLEAMCRRIGEHDSTVRKLLKPRARMRPKVAARICSKLVDLVSPPTKKTKQQEMFA